MPQLWRQIALSATYIRVTPATLGSALILSDACPCGNITNWAMGETRVLTVCPAGDCVLPWINYTGVGATHYGLMRVCTVPVAWRGVHASCRVAFAWTEAVEPLAPATAGSHRGYAQESIVDNTLNVTEFVPNTAAYGLNQTLYSFTRLGTLPMSAV